MKDGCPAVTEIGAKSQINYMMFLRHFLATNLIIPFFSHLSSYISHLSFCSIVEHQQGIAVATEHIAMLEGQLVGLDDVVVTAKGGGGHHHR